MPKSKQKKAARLSTVKSGLIGVTRAVIGRKPKKRFLVKLLPTNAVVIKNQQQLKVLFSDIARAQKASGKEIIIIWLH